MAFAVRLEWNLHRCSIQLRQPLLQLKTGVLAIQIYVCVVAFREKKFNVSVNFHNFLDMKDALVFSNMSSAYISREKIH